MKKTCGIYGISINIQSAEFPPPLLEERILAFIDDFYNKWLDPKQPEMFERYKKAALNRIKIKSSNPEEAAAKYVDKLLWFSQDPEKNVQWNWRQSTIEGVEKNVTLKMTRKFYKLVFGCPDLFDSLV